jgi:hypothetical protein
VRRQHRSGCGKSVCGAAKPFLMVTDPPYGVDYDPTWRADAGVNHNKKKLGTVQNDSRADWTEAWRLFSGSVVYVWHGALRAGEVAESIEAAGFAIRGQIIWVKDRFALSRGHYHWQHEPCWYATKGTAQWSGEPVAAFYERGMGHHVGEFPQLEDEQTNFTTAGYLGSGSPNRADALVWAITELLVDGMEHSGIFNLYRDQAGRAA